MASKHARVKALARRVAAMPRRSLLYSSTRRRRSNGPPIFVVGCPRSGTTLMRQILDSHSRIACPGETWFLCGLYEQLRNPHFAAGLERLGVSRDEVVANLRELTLHYFEAYLYRTGKVRWADKTPGYADYCPEILEVLGPDVRFVYMLRHGLDVVNSMEGLVARVPQVNGVNSRETFWDRVWMGQRPGETDRLGMLRAAARLWIRSTESFRAFQAAHPAICHEVRFEELTADPERVVRGVVEFLGEPWEPGMMDYQSFPHYGLGDYKTPGHRTIRKNSKNYTAWPEDQRRAISELLAVHLHRSGYAVDEPQAGVSAIAR